MTEQELTRCREAFEKHFRGYHGRALDRDMDAAPKDEVILIQLKKNKRVFPVEWNELCPGFLLQAAGNPSIFWRKHEIECWQPLPAPAEVKG